MMTPTDLCKAVKALVNDAAFCDKHKSKAAPIAITALAEVVQEKIVRARDDNLLFNQFLKALQ